MVLFATRHRPRGVQSREIGKETLANVGIMIGDDSLGLVAALREPTVGERAGG